MKTKRGQFGRGPARKLRVAARPSLEALDQRLLLTVYTVTTNLDTGTGSLRAAITASNGDTAQPNEIDFDIAPAGLEVITPATALPAITQAVFINGSTQPAATPGSTPLIEIDGSQTTTVAAALDVQTTGVTIEGLDFQHIGGAAINLDLGGSDTVDGCYIGVDPTGTTLGANTGADGILVGSASNTIGGTTAAARNVIAGFTTGIEIGTGGSSTTVEGNYIGLNAAGTSALSVAGPQFGIDVNSTLNTLGGFTTGSGNVISGWQTGINLANAPSNTIVGNFIGTDATGNVGIGNSSDGILIGGSTGSPSNIIGGVPAGSTTVPAPVVGNVISDNAVDGIAITAASNNTTIQGNDIGVGANGSAILGNGINGIFLNNQTGTVIGLATLTGNPPITETPFGNIIANNGAKAPATSPAAGVLVNGGLNNGILTNSIYNNTGLGIQLAGESASVAAPTITSAVSGGSQTLITGTLFGQQLATYRVQFFSSSSSNPGTGQTFVGEADVTTDASGNATFTETLGNAVGVGLFLTATATSQAASSPSTSEFSAPAQVGQAIVSDLSVAQTPQAVNPLVGQPFSYTIVVTNNGPNDASNVVLTDTLPTNSTLVNTDVGTLSNGVLTIDLGTITAGQSQTVTVTVKPTTTTTDFTNTVSVTSGSIDPNQTNNTATVTSTVLNDADLGVVLTPSANPTPIGSAVTFTLTVTNAGPSNANNAVTTVTLPSDYTGISVSPDQGSYAVNGNVITISSGLIPSSGSSTITITATPTISGTETTTATVSNPGLNGQPALDDPNSANNTVTVPVSTENAADLALTIAAAPEPVLIGQTLFYTITVANNGPSDATNPVITDVLPAGLTFDPTMSSDSSGGTITFDNGTVTDTAGTIPANTSDVFTLAVSPTQSGSVTNSATVIDTNEIDPNTANNTASITSSVNPADISVTVINPNDPLLIGQQYFYQVVVTNGGPAPATNVTLNYTLNGAASFGGSAPGTVNGTTLTDNIGTLASGFSDTINVPVSPSAAGMLNTTASVTSDDFDPNENNNSASSSNLVNPVDLVVAVAGSPASVLVGTPGTFTIVVTNDGTTSATNVEFSDPVPTDSSFVSATSTQGVVALTGSTVIGNVGTLAPGASLTVTLVVTPNAVATITNTATVTSDDYQINPSDSTGSASITSFNAPGSFAFASPVTIIPENAGQVVIPITRTSGTLGAVTLTYTTSDYTAVSGVNYVGTTGTVTFADGQTTADITLSVLDDGIVDGSTGFFVTLSNPTAGSISQPSVAAVLVTNTDRDTIPPDIINLAAIPNGTAFNGFIITFDKAMDPARASLVSNYHILNANGSKVPLAAAVYNATNNTVSLIPTAVLPGNRFYQVIVNGSYGEALTDLSGNVLYGTTGLNTNYDIYYGRGTNLQYVDARQNLVTISVGGPGLLEIVRAPDGDAVTVNISDVTPGVSSISGSVKKLTRAATGQTVIQSINGFGQFGDVKSNLTTPGFYVVNTSVPTNFVPVSATALPVVVSKKTPKGPSLR